MSNNVALKHIFYEFLRYVLVGGSAFFIDIGILYLTKIFVFQGLGTTGILLATACGFIGGLIYNYILSLVFVFKKTSEYAKKHKVRSFIIFTIIGVIGLGLTELMMYGGIKLFGENFYLPIKIFTAGVVLIWNYAGRKVLIFRGDSNEQH